MRLHLILVTCLFSNSTLAASPLEPQIFSYVRVIPACRDIAAGRNLTGEPADIMYQGFCGGVLLAIREVGIRGDPKSTCIPDHVTVIDMVREVEREFKDSIAEYNQSPKDKGMNEKIAGLIPFVLQAHLALWKKWPCKSL